MLNFPVPYPEELLYSTIARAGIRHGLTSPKQLLDEVFESNRKVIATIDLPNYLNSLTRQLPDRFTIESLAYEHTLFPLYAPFLPEERRVKCLVWMEAQSQGSVHLATGVAASIVKTPGHIRYCSTCLKEQTEQNGEYFWVRLWQTPGVNCCPDHGILLNSKLIRPQKERHQFWPATPEHCPLLPLKAASDKDRWIAKKAIELLGLGPCKSPSLSQWSIYYQRLALHAGLTRGQVQVDHDEIFHRVRSYWTPQYLRAIGLPVTRDEHDWLKGIFRKHRKSFSYLQHLVVLGALLPKGWSISGAIEYVRSIVQPSENTHIEVSDLGVITNLSDDQKYWLSLLSTQGVKGARTSNPALYARLYRGQRIWLTNTNREHKRPARPKRKYRVNWEAKDAEYLQQLQELVVIVTATNSGPRRSRNFWLHGLSAPATIEKHLAQLPLTSRLLQYYSETVADFQIRRLTLTYESLKEHIKYPPRWRLLRASSLSEQRLTPLARKFLKTLELQEDEQESTQNQRYS